VGFAVTWLDSDGNEEAADAYSVGSDLEDPLALDGSGLIATLAGAHTLTATATDGDGTEQSAEASLSVEAGAAVLLTVDLSPTEVPAGEAVAYTLSAQDSYGNEVATADAEIASDESVTIADGSLSSGLAGEHTATATLHDLQGEGTWTVLPGPAASIDLVLEEPYLELGDATAYTVAVTDAYGNETDDPTEVGVDEDGAIVSDGSIEFQAEGLFHCWAVVPDTDLVDVETVFIDSTGPQITILTPDRGTWTTESVVTVSGTVEDEFSGIGSLAVNGVAVDEITDGAFSQDVALGFGVTILETTATDTDLDESGVGNQSSDIRAVLQADAFWDPSERMDDGLIFRMWEGAGGLGEFEGLASTLMDTVDLDGMLDEPIYDEEFCFTFWWWEICRDITIYLDSIDYDDVSLSIDPTAEGVVNIRLTLDNVVMAIHTEGYVEGEGSVSATALNVDISFVPAVSSDGYLEITEFVVSVPTPDGFEVEIDEELEDAADLIGIDPVEMIEEQLAIALAGPIEDAVPDLLAETLGALAFDQEFEISDNTYTLSSRLQSVDVDEYGITFKARTRVEVAEVIGGGTVGAPEGSPYFGYLPPVIGDTGSATQFSLSTDLLNQLMFALWQGGLLDQELTHEDLGLDMAVVDLLLPGLDALNMIMTPMLPPVVVPRTDWSEGNEYDLYLGDMLVEIHNGEVTDESLVIELYISAVAPLALSAEMDDWSIGMSLSDPVVYADAVYIDPMFTVSPAVVEGLFVSLMADYLPELTEALGAMPLPEIEGMSLGGISTAMDGEDAPPGYWVLSGSLE
jgi:hypothetical protein